MYLLPQTGYFLAVRLLNLLLGDWWEKTVMCDGKFVQEDQ